jgi:hypothetical protein
MVRKVQQGIKPASFSCGVCGTTEVVPFYKTSYGKSFSAARKARTFQIAVLSFFPSVLLRMSSVILHSVERY